MWVSAISAQRFGSAAGLAAAAERVTSSPAPAASEPARNWRREIGGKWIGMTNPWFKPLYATARRQAMGSNFAVKCRSMGGSSTIRQPRRLSRRANTSPTASIT